MATAFSGIGRSKVDDSRVSEVKAWVRQALSIGDDVMVLITELPCSEPGCPPVETAITLIGDDMRAVYTVHGPVASLSRDAVERALNG